MSKFIDSEFSATARSKSGRSYSGSRIATATHILDIPAELAALVRAAHASDFNIVEVDGTAPGNTSVSPLVLKVLVDHGARTGIPIKYTLRTTGGKVIYETSNVRSALPFYQSPGAVLEIVAQRALADVRVAANSYSEETVEQKLRECAIQGIMRNFPTRNGASGYGAAVRTVNGDIYFGGQYSAFDERLGVHAEMAVLLNALLSGATGFTHVGIASSKFPDSIAPPCGSCRQFLAEAARATLSTPTIHLFASKTDEKSSYSLEELLPVQWTNKK